ncbi:MAG: hypothetical protein ACI86H_002336 [bacterium]|jgi:hypothetical protein
MKFRIVTVFLIALYIFASSDTKVFAQDQGSPGLQKVGLFTIGGGAAGGILGLGYILADPLNPGLNKKESIFTGVAIGAIAGFIFGINSLTKSMVIPGKQQQQQNLPTDDLLQGNLHLPQRYEQPANFKNQEQKSKLVYQTPIYQFRF